MKRTHLLTAMTGLLAAALLLLTLPGCGEDGGGTNPDGNTRHVAIYRGTGVEDLSAQRVKTALDSMGVSSEFVVESDIQASLADFGLIVFPGGDPLEMNRFLGVTGRSNIALLLSSGGGFIGLGGGAYLAADSMVYRQSGSGVNAPIALFEGTALGPLDGLAAGNDALVQVIDNRFDPTLDSYPLFYENGPGWEILFPNGQVVAEFVTTGGPAVVLLEPSFGRVALSAVQLEQEETDRWFLRRLVEWCFREMP